MSYTKGKWDWKNGVLCSEKYIVGGIYHAFNESNKALIAAAPDLLECLTDGAQLSTPDFLDWIADRLVNVHGENTNVDYVFTLRDRANKMRKAIAKARGVK